MRGQTASALEHAIPEQMWIDRTQCRYSDEFGQVINSKKLPCAQGISAIKAISIAQAEGQRIYTINQNNAVTALAALPIGGNVGSEIRSAIDSGKEVVVHERAINSNGWSGYGYIIVDPETGAGGYLIEGGGNGSFLDWWSDYGNGVAFVLFFASLVAAALSAGAFVVAILAVFSIFSALMNIMVIRLAMIENGCDTSSVGFFEGMEWLAVALSFFGAGGVAAGAFLSFLSGNGVSNATNACRR
jgi:ABC-type multidrug transport system fused ATPase/permease subunit